MFDLSALLIGFLGSFHCVAMCGPIALALTGSNENNFKYIAGRSVYNLGRIFTYAILGILAGAAGHTLKLAGFQQSFSIAIGVLMICFVVLYHYSPALFRANQFSVKLNQIIKKIFARQLQKRDRFSLFISGMANGILPCGFVYIGLAGAAATQYSFGGMWYMVLFGLGTFPAMMAVSVFGKLAGFSFRNFISRISPVLMICLGLFFIYRGMMISENNHCHQSHNNTIGYHVGSESGVK